MNLSDIPLTQWHRHLGAISGHDGKTQFCVWAPRADRVDVDLVDQNRSFPLSRIGEYHTATLEEVKPGDRYMYRIDGGPPRPDPATRFQPDGVHGPSEVVSISFDWTDQNWQGVATEDLIIYEMHVGSFSKSGTFEGAIGRLDELVELGVSAVELMPVADSAGRWNWGYDGVCLFAPHRNFGRPESFRRFVNEAHRRGLAVILDVVYNHLGPEGNYWSEYGPFLSARYETAWGDGPNFDDPAVRRFFLANVLHWFDEYHLDALRVDAIHCMKDEGNPHIVEEIASEARRWSAETNRPAMLIAESNVYDQAMITPASQGGIGYDAEWCDDFLHSVFAVVRPGEQLCHRKYVAGSDLKQTLETGFVYEGSVRQPRERRPKTSGRVATDGMIYSIQNHDFIGNHPLGKRFHQLTSVETQKAAAALLLLNPAIPMLFMGEEFACENPFRFFVDFGDEHLRQAVVEGRKREYPQHDWSGGVSPIDPEAFRSSKIGSALSGDVGVRSWYQALIRLRKRLRASGLLCDQCITVTCDLPTGHYQFTYDNGSESVTVHVRLSPQSGTPNRLPIHPTETLLLDSLAEEQGDAESGETLLPNHAKVFVSRGIQTRVEETRITTEGDA